MKWYGTDYKPLWKNNSVAYFEHDVETLIASEGKTWTALPQKVQYTLPQDHLEVYAPINWSIQYLKLDLENGSAPLYFYRNDMSEVLAVNKATGILDMTWTFTMDYYYTYFRDMFEILKQENPEIYFLRKFADRLASKDLSSPRINFNEQFWYNNKLPIDIQGSYTEQFSLTNAELMNRNLVSNFTAQGFVNTDPTTWTDITAIKPGFEWTDITFSPDLDYNSRTVSSNYWTIQFIANDNNNAIKLTNSYYGEPSDFIRVEVIVNGTSHTIFEHVWGSLPKWFDSQSFVFGSYSAQWNKENRRFTLTTPLNNSRIDKSRNDKIWSGTWSVADFPQSAYSFTTSFADQSVGDKYRYALVSKDLITTDIGPYTNFYQYCNDQGIDMFIVPLPVHDFTITDSNGNTTVVPISSYNQFLYNYASSEQSPVLWTDTNVKQTFEMPICFDLIAGDSVISIDMKENDTNYTLPLIMKPIYSDTNQFQIYLTTFNLLPIHSPFYLFWIPASEPYITYSTQFTRYYFGLDNSLTLPTTDFEFTSASTPISFYMTINDKVTLKLDTRQLAPGSKLAQDVSLYQTVISNNTARTTSAYNNWLQNNLTTEATARANLADEKKMMDRNIAWGWVSGAMNLLGGNAGNSLFGAGANYNSMMAADYNTAESALAALSNYKLGIAGGIGNLASGIGNFFGGNIVNTLNQQTMFGMKQRSLESQFANIRKAPQSINNVAIDNQNIPLITDGILMQREGLTPEQEEVVMQELYNYGYPYGGVDALSSYDNRILYNVIQVNTEYNRETLEQIIKSNYDSGIWNFTRAIDNFLDWLGSIHRFYKTNTFDVNPIFNIESWIPNIYYSIDPVRYQGYEPFNYTATLTYWNSSISSVNIVSSYDLPTLGSTSSITVDFSDYPLGENHTFAVDWELVAPTVTYDITPSSYIGSSVDWTSWMYYNGYRHAFRNGTQIIPPEGVSAVYVDFSNETFGSSVWIPVNYTYENSTELYNLVAGNVITQIDWSRGWSFNGFSATMNFGSGNMNINFAPSSITVGTSNSIMNNGVWQPSFTNDYVSWDLSTKILTFNITASVLTNNFGSSTYVGSIPASLAS